MIMLFPGCMEQPGIPMDYAVRRGLSGVCMAGACLGKPCPCFWPCGQMKGENNAGGFLRRRYMACPAGAGWACAALSAVPPAVAVGFVFGEAAPAFDIQPWQP